MKRFPWLLLLLVSTACDRKESIEPPSKEALTTPDQGKGPTQADKKVVTKKPAAEKGQFTGSFGDKKYDLEVSCRHLDKDYFQLQSDRTQMKDSNGDGIVIFGAESDGRFTLSFTDGDEYFSTFKLTSFEKSKSGVKGAGTLATEDNFKKRDIKFEVTCP